MAPEYISSFQDKKLFELVQKDFPLSKRPFYELGLRIGLSEEEVIARLVYWKEKGILRQISAIFEPSFFGHHSALFALKVPPQSLEKAAKVINAHPGVSHNYLRNSEYQLWFILVVPPGKDLFEEANSLARASEAEEMLYLPVLRTFKISTVFGVDSSDQEEDEEEESFSEHVFSSEDINIVKALQEPLDLSPRPFSLIAQKLKISEEQIFSWIKTKKQIGALRRFGALMKSNKLGLKTNFMVAWEVKDPSKKEELGAFLARQKFVSHCYERKSYTHWPFNIYSMCHFSSKEEVQIIHEIAKKFSVENYLMLETLKELKKVRLKLFYD